jgi:predicted nucleotidyltransferase component of viral defense system
MNEQALKDRLQTISKQKGIHFNDCWKKLLLERFLVRLSRSKHAEKFIFKGGFLLAYMMEIGRETMDLDFLLTNMTASEEKIVETIQEVILTISEDGFSFSHAGIEPLEQPHMDYSGYRISLKVEFGRMRDKIQIDIGIGDIVTPTNRDLHLFTYKGKPMFEEEISLLVYPLETIFAEKLETVLSKGAINSRMKDYHDLLLLVRNPSLIQLKSLEDAIQSTFKNRGTIFELINFDEGLKLLQKLWTAHLQDLGNKNKDLELPKDIQEAIKEINSYLVQMKMISLGKMIAD